MNQDIGAITYLLFTLVQQNNPVNNHESPFPTASSTNTTKTTTVTKKINKMKHSTKDLASQKWLHLADP